MATVRKGQLGLRALLGAAVAGLFLGTSGCATYSEKLAEVREFAAQGDYESGVAGLTNTLGVKAADWVLQGRRS